MKAFLKSALCVAAGLLVATSVNAQDKKVDPNGKWTWTTEGRQGNVLTNSVTLKLDGDKLTGTMSGGFRGRGGGGGGGAAPQDVAIEEAKLTGDEVSFQVTFEFGGNTRVTKYTGKIAGDTLKGKIVRQGRDGQPQEREFEAKREVKK